MLTEIIERQEKFSEIKSKLLKSGQIIHGLTNPAKSVVLSNLRSAIKSPIVFITQNHHEAATYYRELKNLNPNCKIFNFLSHEVSAYDQINSDVSIISSQFEVIESWQKQEPSITVVNFKALTQQFINYETYQGRKITVKKDKEFDPLKLAEELILLGYTKITTVENKGQFSQRGDITDIYPIVGDPVRIEFFGDQIESIRTFNLTTQRSIKKINEFQIHPKYSLVRSRKDSLKENILKVCSNEGDLKETLQESEELYWEGIEYYREFSDQAASGFFQFLPSNCHLIFDEWQDLFTQVDHFLEKQDDIYRESLGKNKILALKKKLYFDSDYIRNNLDKVKQKLYLQTLAEEKESLSYEIKTFPTERFASKIENFVTYIKEVLFRKKTVLIYSEQPQRVLGIMKEWDIPAEYTGADDETDKLIENFTQKKVYIQRDGVEEGFQFPDLDLIILTDRELFGKSRQAVAKQKKKIIEAAEKREGKNIYTDISEIQAGNYVVHYKHGVGIYRGTEIIELDSGRIKAEYLAIEYADEARVLIPVDQVNMLSRFNVNQEVKPRLSKLGGTEWDRTKSKVKKSVRKIAQDLINLYALRKKQTGYKYPPDTPWQIEIEDAFPYQETEDQLKAITELKMDMEAEKLMDRLICGDAGFGKTEVILRAVFKVIMEGRQVAILVPTTVLAQQHFDVFSDRYAPYPIRVGLLSRFRTAAQQKEVVQKLKVGEMDLVIGTHRLLQKDLQFKDLGLLVIDEEQRFGVAHKEKLKQIRKDLDVVSMSATPIPRTLHMSLSGIRDISLITTAPTNRKPVKTYVGEFKGSLIRNAILHELERGGKIFFVHNRVENIEQIAYQIQDMVPEASVRYAHGQMKDRELEDVMFSFINNEFNVLVSTTIIETGLDISEANTIIINSANNFGLSQLYQLRGRVGRSDVQAYAYLLYSSQSEISETARQRLKAIRELTNLGSGYQIALRDMEIRGVGNVFGAEQHGQMLSVGFDLYCKILSDTIEELKGNIEDVKEYENGCNIEIKVNAYFPQTWIEDERQRMNEYKRLASTRSEAMLDNLVNEWQDRFGRIPLEAQNLVEVSRIKNLASQAMAKSINQDGDTIRIHNGLRLQNWLKIQRKLENFLQPRLGFKPGAVGSRGSDSVISINVSGLDSDVILQTLRDILELMKDSFLQ
jgi:transcription-repair coupling factor (superfamily II helicase)